MSYTKTAYISNRRASGWSRNQNTTVFASTIKLGPVTHTVLIALMITVLGLIYLTQATRATSYDYVSQKIDDRITTLASQKTDLEVENARLTAIETIQKSSVAANLTAPSEVEYAGE